MDFGFRARLAPSPSIRDWDRKHQQPHPSTFPSPRRRRQYHSGDSIAIARIVDRGKTFFTVSAFCICSCTFSKLWTFGRLSSHAFFRCIIDCGRGVTVAQAFAIHYFGVIHPELLSLFIGAIAHHHEWRREIKDMTRASLDDLHEIDHQDDITTRGTPTSIEEELFEVANDADQYRIRDQITMLSHPIENYLESLRVANRLEISHPGSHPEDRKA
ncbi:hypothetical protein G7Y89_g5827 [Cudoniella acicularis]|uniref:C2H2-type domain-containing protein n=1 Tax=Cudoniella acicularis TaxID=354080 RepID=A0A8H4RLS7_9HELO|nr:hypothetical protein G7Y89_g5827 [Cudoniella acicularis]